MTRRFKRHQIRLFMIIGSLLLQGCGLTDNTIFDANQDNQPIMDNSPTVGMSILKNISSVCSQPCWLGLEPGITREQANRILIEKYGTDNVEMADEDTIAWETEDLSHAGRVLLFDNIVDGVDVYFAEDTVTVSDLLYQLGEPELVGMPTLAPQCAVDTLMYPDLGVRAILFPQDEIPGVSPSQTIYGLEFGWGLGVVLDEGRANWEGYIDYCD